MRISTVLRWLIGAHFIQGFIGLPVDRELYRVKRKGEIELKNEEDLVHSSSVIQKVRRSQDDKETEIRHKRRFFALDTAEHKNEGQHYKTKMEARSSRSSREDNDITARRPERFRVRKRATTVKGETSGSGMETKGDNSGSGFWDSENSGPLPSSKRDDKRSMNSNTLDSLIAALQAISAVTPEAQSDSTNEEEFSGSGLWLKKENAAESTPLDDKLPKFFEEEASSSASGENAEQALDMIAKTAEAELNKKVEAASGLEESSKIAAGGINVPHKNGNKLFRRELHSDSLKDDLLTALQDARESDDSDASHATFPSGSGDETQEREDKITGEPDIKETRSLTDVLLPDTLYRTKRSFQANSLFRSDSDLGGNDALVGDSLVARFYRDQKAQDSAEATDSSAASLPSEPEAGSSTEDHVPFVKRDFEQGQVDDLLVTRELNQDHVVDLSAPRVVYTREIRDAPKPIIERPAVFTRSISEDDMDTSYGGDDDDDDDDDDTAIVIHERDIREDGYVGCYEDKSPERDLPTVLSVPKLTPDTCRTACREAGNAYAGVQYGYLCRCGDSYGRYSKVADEQCSARCEGDHAQKCGGFWRSAIFTTAGAMEASKRGNFFHIESVQPIPEDIFESPRSEIASVDKESPVSPSKDSSILSPKHTHTESSLAAVTHELPGSSIEELHKEPPPIAIDEVPAPKVSVKEKVPASTPIIMHGNVSTEYHPDYVPAKVVVKAPARDSVNKPPPQQPIIMHGNVATEYHPDYVPVNIVVKAPARDSVNKPPPQQPIIMHGNVATEYHPDYVPVNVVVKAPARDSVPAPAVSSKPPPQPPVIMHGNVATEYHPDYVPAKVVVKAPARDSVPAPAVSSSIAPPAVISHHASQRSHLQHDQKPQGTHVSQLVYMHQQQDILSKPTPRTIFPEPPGKMKAGTVAYTGTVKLKQSWLDQLEDINSAESKILTGNIEQAFKHVFANDPNFVKAKVADFREGLVKHNPNTIRKVIAPFILTFKNGAKGVVDKLKNMVQNSGKLDDMPVYNTSLHMEEYSRVPAVKPNAAAVKSQGKHEKSGDDRKRSAVNVPNGGVDPFLKGIFSQIST